MSWRENTRKINKKNYISYKNVKNTLMKSTCGHPANRIRQRLMQLCFMFQRIIMHINKKEFP
jgi:hypothetical protein